MKTYFSDLLNQHDSEATGSQEATQQDGERETGYMLNRDISFNEVRQAARKLRKGKSTGYDEIPAEVLCFDSSLSFLHRFFRICFRSCVVPKQWGVGIINPIQKANCTDSRDPAGYRGITLTSAVYKLYCAILNERLNKWVEENGILADSQNGFRKHRNTVDHLSTLTSLIETRKLLKKSTFVCFVDFRKAYDNVNRSLMWDKLRQIGINGKMYNNLRAIYDYVKCSVRINGHHTDWFNVNAGLKQGCLLSPILFNLFVNDLTLAFEGSGYGIDIDGTKVSVLQYADDIAIIAESEEQLQNMLDILYNWCRVNKMQVNLEKTNVVHYRNASTSRTDCTFQFGTDKIDISESYKYLGLVLDEFLNYDITAKYVANSATRALGLIIAKDKAAGGLPYEVFTKLFDTIVWPTINYGAAIWGTKDYSCINAVQNRACRYFLGVGKYTPNNGVNGDMGWTPVCVKQWGSVLKLNTRMESMDDSRLNQKVHRWMCNKRGYRCKNWSYRLLKQLEKFNIQENSDNSADFSNAMLLDYKAKWVDAINSERGASSTGNNKLRTYKLFKETYHVEAYVKIVMPKSWLSFVAVLLQLGWKPVDMRDYRWVNVYVLFVMMA